MEDYITTTLEPLVKEHGLLHVLTGLELLCHEQATAAKVDNDPNLAHKWQREADNLCSILDKVEL